MKFQQYLSIFLFVATMLVLSSCSQKEEAQKTEKAPAVTVVLGGGEGNSPENSFVNASGKLTAQNTVNVSTRMMGYVTKLNAKVGQHVSAGQLLVSINSADLEAKKAQVDAQITQAKTGLASAQKDYDRFKTLFAQQSATQKELDDMTTRLEMAKAGVSAAQQMKNEVLAQFKYANIAAPISGVVSQKLIEVGDIATPGMPMLVIEEPSHLQATVLVAENAIANIKQGMMAKILVKSNGQHLSGKVVEISPSAAMTGGQFVVKTSVEKGDAKVLSGMFVNVQFPIAFNKEKAGNIKTLLIPKSALVLQGQLTGLYTVSSEKTALLRWVKIGKDYGDQIEILSGLNPDEKYIVSAQGKLFNGVPLKI